MKKIEGAIGDKWWWTLPQRFPFPYDDQVTVITHTAEGNETTQHHDLHIVTLGANLQTTLNNHQLDLLIHCLLYTSPSPRD